MKQARIQLVFVAAVMLIWQMVYKFGVFPEIMFPSIGDIGGSFLEGFVEDGLLTYTLYSLSLIFKGMFIGIVLAFTFSSLSIISETFYSIYNLMVSICDLIPGVALLPLAILWFGINEITVIFIVVHSIIWPMSRNIIDGFNSVENVYIESGKNYGLTGINLVKDIYLPASFNNVLSGLKVGWARAWRGLISVEMIFGTTSSGAGIGWYIYMKRTNIDSAGVFAALLVIIIIGVVIEYLIFGTIEKHTVKKWGMVR